MDVTGLIGVHAAQCLRDQGWQVAGAVPVEGLLSDRAEGKEARLARLVKHPRIGASVFECADVD